MEKSFTYIFPNKRIAHAIHVHHKSELPLALHALGIQYPCPTIVLIGGASGIDEDELTELRGLFAEVLAPLAESLGAAIVDGGTNVGVMQLIGRAYNEIHATFPLIGVAASGTIALSDTLLDRPHNELFEPHHTHFLLVPGTEWGQETSWIAYVASELAKGKPSITILVNGGEIAWDDVAQSLQAHRPVMVIAGSGRTADTLASALLGDVTDNRANKLIASGLLQAVDPSEGFDQLTKTIREKLV